MKTKKKQHALKSAKNKKKTLKIEKSKKRKNT